MAQPTQPCLGATTTVLLTVLLLLLFPCTAITQTVIPVSTTLVPSDLTSCPKGPLNYEWLRPGEWLAIRVYQRDQSPSETVGRMNRDIREVLCMRGVRATNVSVDIWSTGVLHGHRTVTVQVRIHCGNSCISEERMGALVYLATRLLGYISVEILNDSSSEPGLATSMIILIALGAVFTLLAAAAVALLLCHSCRKRKADERTVWRCPDEQQQEKIPVASLATTQPVVVPGIVVQPAEVCPDCSKQNPTPAQPHTCVNIASNRGPGSLPPGVGKWESPQTKS